MVFTTAIFIFQVSYEVIKRRRRQYFNRKNIYRMQGNEDLERVYSKYNSG